MDKPDIPFLSATDLSRLIARKGVSPVEATEAYLDRIDDLDFKFNSYLTVCRKEALRGAREAERAIAQGNYLGPLHGVPVAMKDQIWTRGIRSLYRRLTYPGRFHPRRGRHGDCRVSAQLDTIEA